MIPKELFEKVKRIEIKTSRLVADVFAGEYHSVFKGQGIEFDEVREYNPGDDIRTIDWNVTARTGTPHIKKFQEERELTVMLLVDVSKSCRFASSGMLKSQIAAEISALLALSAIRNNDKVGLIIFTDQIELFIPPKKGPRHALRVLREALYFEPEHDQTDITCVLEYLNHVTTRKTISFLISDFFTQNVDIDPALKKMLAVTNRRHDLIAVTLNDQRERELKDSGLILMEDAETGEMNYVDSSSAMVRRKFREISQQRCLAREQLFRSIGMDQIDIWTHESYSDALVKFFLKRRKRAG